MQQYGKTPTVMLRDAGVFKYPVLAAHCVHLTDEDISILADHRVRVVHNPQSNMKLASGIARVPEMLAAGITVALGTDGASSNNNLDMVEELRACSLLHKVNSMNPQVIPAYQALEMATVNGARALGLEGEVGMLKPGMKADLIQIWSSRIITPIMILLPIWPMQDSQLMYTVIVNCRILMENRRLTTIDEQQVKAEVKKSLLALSSNSYDNTEPQIPLMDADILQSTSPESERAHTAIWFSCLAGDTPVSWRSVDNNVALRSLTGRPLQSV